MFGNALRPHSSGPWPLVLAVFLLSCSCSQTRPPDTSEGRPPNVVLVFMDDMGYADIGPFGARGYPTPNLDRMAAEGMRFTDFQVSAAVCTASRAALMTGCYHRRIGLSGALGPSSDIGIHQQEVTLGELCRSRGYATACFGKWHLGHHPKFLPLQHGFDEYYGLPYSNDMWPGHPTAGDRYPDLPLIEGNQVINPKVTGEDQSLLTTQYTERAVDFIERNRDRPFLLYLPHSMVHVPLYVSDKFRGSQRAGSVRRRGHGDRLVRGTDYPRPGTHRSGPEHADDLHFRQRPLAQLRGSRRVCGSPEGGQGHVVRRRNPGPHPDALAGADPGGYGVQRTGRDHRRPSHGRRSDRRGSARTRDRREGHPAP